MDSAETKEELSKLVGQCTGSKQAPFPSYFPPMLASLSDSPFRGGDSWIYEPKMDGMRCIAFVDGGKVKLLSRRGQNITSQYPALAAALPALCKCRMVLDGEIIALNSQGRPSFQLLQKRMNLQKVTDIGRADASIPVHYFVFDLVHAAEYNLARCSLLDRKNLLRACLQPATQVLILSSFEGDGRIAYEACVENGFEGIVAKRRESIYEVGRRSPNWIKVKAQKSSEFVIGGYSLGQGGRASTFGSLVLGYYNDAGKLVYVGSAGSGFDERGLQDLLKRMEPLKTKVCPFERKPEDKKDAIWLQPELVAEVKFLDFTDELHLRNPVFLHLRHDIVASDVRLISAISPIQADERQAPPREVVRNATNVKTESEREQNKAITYEAPGSARPDGLQRVAEAQQDRLSHSAKETGELDEIGSSAGGFSAAGSSVDGYSVDGYSVDGYSVDGYSVDGYSVDGSSAAGSNAAGSNAAGSNAAGSNAAGSNAAGSSAAGSSAAHVASTKALDLEILVWQTEAQKVIAQLGGREKNMKLTVQQATFSLTNLDKVLFPAYESFAAITKREFLKTIALLSPYMLTHLHNRPLTMIRAPSGMKSRSFYQKHWNLDIPDFIETIQTEIDDPTRKDLLICNNVAALIFLAQHNILEYHTWLSQVLPEDLDPALAAKRNAELAHLELPDFMVFDMDFHKEGESEADRLDLSAFDKTREATFKLNELLKSLSLKTFLKTSGRNGLHIYVPIEAELKFENVRTLAEQIARHLESKNASLVATNPVQARKSSRVFIDYYQNSRGRSLAAPYTPRLSPSATISTPIEWDELASIVPTDFSHRTIHERLDIKGDIWRRMLEQRESLSKRFSQSK